MQPEHHHDAAGAGHHGDEHSNAIDPVCGMTVDPDAARAKGLNLTHDGVEYFFCGRGCKLEFGEDPERFLDPGHVPSM